MFGLSLFRPSRQSNISTSGEERFKYPFPRENKISQMPYPRDNKDNQIPTPCPASPPAGITLIGALYPGEMKNKGHANFFFGGGGQITCIKGDVQVANLINNHPS